MSKLQNEDYLIRLNERRNFGFVLRCVLVGGLITFCAIFLGFIALYVSRAEGVVYVLACLFFPWPMVLMMHSSAINSFIVGYAQFPLYGLLIGLAAMQSKKTMWAAVICLAICHLIAAVVTFLALIS